jgi:hypothetical protein
LNSEVLPLFGVPTKARCINGGSMALYRLVRRQ